MGLTIRTLKLKDRRFNNWKSEIEDRWDYDDMLADEGRRKDWISFDCLCYYEENDTVYAGLTSFDADIFWGYDRKKNAFVPTGYERVADPYDAKFHRCLLKYKGCLYGAVGLLHDIDRYWDAPGGAIVKFDPKTRAIEKIGVPVPHAYIQSIILDESRGIIYGQTFTPEKLFSFDLNTRKSKDIGPVGSGLAMGQGQNMVLDDDGNVWGAWGVTRAWQNAPGIDSFRLYRYRPDWEKIEYLKTGLPNPDGSHGYVHVESLFNFSAGMLYASGGKGSLYRIDPSSGKAEYLFTPISDRPSRLASMAQADNRYAYGVIGGEGRTELLRFDIENETFDLLGELKDAGGISCWQIHDIIALPDGTLYAAENDVPDRSGYLWEIRI